MIYKHVKFEDHIAVSFPPHSFTCGHKIKMYKGGVACI